MIFLNFRGITNGAFFNFMGWGPSWMMVSDATSGSLKPGMEAEWAEMIAYNDFPKQVGRLLYFDVYSPDSIPTTMAMSDIYCKPYFKGGDDEPEE